VEIFRYFNIPNDAILLAFASLLGWAYMFFFIMPFRFTGPFVIMIYKMLFNDVLRFCIIYMIFLAGFSQAFFILFHEDGKKRKESEVKRMIDTFLFRFLGLWRYNSTMFSWIIRRFRFR